MFARHRAAFWQPAEAADSLVRLAFLERSLAHILAGWAVKLPDFDAKLAFGLQMNRAMERALALRSRVNGLCHATASEAMLAAGWRSMLEQIDRSETPARLLCAIYRWLHPRLLDLYRAHLRNTDPDGDRASVELIRGFLPLIGSDRRDGLSLRPASRRGDSGAWLARLDDMWSDRESGAPIALAQALWAPVDRVPAAARPPGLPICEPGSLGLLPIDPLSKPRDIAMFLHKELDEEFTTLELVARNSYEHPDMPWEFHRDMLRQASDEARHAIIIDRLMKARGVRHGDFPLSTASYDGLYEFRPCAPGSRTELLWRLLIRQTFEEGLALDNLAHEIERRRSAGQADVATAFDYILRDEVFHAASGLRWSRWLVGPQPGALAEARDEAVGYLARRAEAEREDFVIGNLDRAMGELAAVEAGKKGRSGKPPERPLNRIGRLQAGFAEDDIAQVVRWGYATDDRAAPGELA